MAHAVLLRAAVAMTGRFPALAGVDLEVGEGEAVVLMGPNGAGKTSVLRACAGLLRVSSGEALVLGYDLVDDPLAARREVAMLGHAAALYEDLSVTENVRFAVRAAGGDPGRVRGALERLGLGGRLARTQVARLSAGQKKRVALAVVLARRPSLWLLDEPHASLDASAREELGEIIAEALAKGATVLMASHEADAADRIAGRVVMMAGGRVVSDQPVVRTPAHSALGANPVVALRGGAHVA
jgi:ABC-2 type transport system ATP-binding protein